MLISPTFLCTMSDFSRFVALILRCRLQSVHFHLLIPKDTFAIIATKSHLLIFPTLLWYSSSHTVHHEILCNIFYIPHSIFFRPAA